MPRLMPSAAVLVVAGAAALAGCGDDAASHEGGGTRTAVVRVAEVTDVVDGDTIRVRFPGARGTERVRLLGIDAPELSTTRTGYAECGGRASADALARVLPVGTAVRLTTDPTQDRRDRFGRLLAYVGLSAGTAQERLLSAGWARVYVYDAGLPFGRVDPFRRAARQAQVGRRGVWGVCGGDFSRPVR